MNLDEAADLVVDEFKETGLFANVYHSATSANIRDTSQRMIHIRAMGPQLADLMHESVGVTITEADVEKEKFLDVLHTRIDNAVKLYMKHAEKETSE
jgi:hypothetical protein